MLSNCCVQCFVPVGARVALQGAARPTCRQAEAPRGCRPTCDREGRVLTSSGCTTFSSSMSVVSPLRTLMPAAARAVQAAWRQCTASRAEALPQWPCMSGRNETDAGCPERGCGAASSCTALLVPTVVPPPACVVVAQLRHDLNGIEPRILRQRGRDDLQRLGKRPNTEGLHALRATREGRAPSWTFSTPSSQYAPFSPCMAWRVLHMQRPAGRRGSQKRQTPCKPGSWCRTYATHECSDAAGPWSYH